MTVKVKLPFWFEIEVFHGGEDSSGGHLACDAVCWCGRLPTHRKTTLPPSSPWTQPRRLRLELLPDSLFCSRLNNLHWIPLLSLDWKRNCVQIQAYQPLHLSYILPNSHGFSCTNNLNWNSSFHDQCMLKCCSSIINYLLITLDALRYVLLMPQFSGKVKG